MMPLPSPARVAGSVVRGGRGEKKATHNAISTMTIRARPARKRIFVIKARQL
jgi:hypothetical protein